MISVIMLTYNREKLVIRAIESILAQTYPDFEFIIVDNGSTDRSGEIADKYAAKDDRIRIIHRGRGNIGAGRNTGLDAAQGEYIAFIDDDDWAESDFLEFLLNLIEENQADVAICGATGKAFDVKKIMPAEDALIELLRRKKFNAGFPTKMFRSALISGLQFSENDKFDDIGLMYRLIANAHQVAYHGLPKYHVLRHTGNNSSWTTNHQMLTPEILKEYLNAYRARTAWLCEWFPESAEAFQYFEWSFMISMIEKITRLELSCCASQLATMKRELQLHRDRFINAPEILDFEKEWMEAYVPAAN